MQDYRSKLNHLLGEYQHSVKRVKEEKEALRSAEQYAQAASTAQQLVQTVAQEIQTRAHERIATIVSRCLELVFEEPYQFKIEFVRKRGQTEAKLTFVRGELELDPMTASGGGAVDVASTALRLACLILGRPAKRRLLVLDEPWKHLSEQYRPAVREMVETLAKELDIQWIIVTHSEELEIGKVVRL